MVSKENSVLAGMPSQVSDQKYLFELISPHSYSTIYWPNNSSIHHFLILSLSKLPINQSKHINPT